MAFLQYTDNKRREGSSEVSQYFWGKLHLAEYWFHLQAPSIIEVFLNIIG